MNTQEILDKIDFEMSKMMGKSKNKMTNEEFRAFVTEQWELMGNDKYQNYDAKILVARMQNEAIWAHDPDDLVKWIKEHQKMQNFHNNSLEIKYNYYKRQFENCQAFEQALAFFKEQNTPEAVVFVEHFQNLVENPQKTQEFTQNLAEDETDMVNFITLEKWSEFFDEEVKIHYTLLRKDGEETERHSKQHKNGLAYLQENQEEILQNFLGELLKEYPNIQEKFADFYTDEEKAEFMPEIKDISGFSLLLSPVNMFVSSQYLNDLPYYSIGFSCSWEREHGLGVIMHQNRVVKLCDASEIFYVDNFKG